MNEDIFHLGVKALIRNSNNQILLLKVNKQALTGYSGEEYWDIPGGRIHKNSTQVETLQREVEEELGIDEITNINQLLMVLSNIRIPIDENNSAGLILSIFTCDINDGVEIRLSEEHSGYNWFSPKEASDKLSFKYPSEFTHLIANL